MTKVKPIPDGYPRVTPYRCVDGASAAIEFYTAVLGATERMRMNVATHIEDVPPDEMARRAATLMGGG